MKEGIPRHPRNVNDVNDFSDFWSWTRLGLLPLVFPDLPYTYSEGIENVVPAGYNLSALPSRWRYPGYANLEFFLELAMNPAPFGMYIKRYDKLLSPQCRISAISMYDAAATCLLVHMAKAVTWKFSILCWKWTFGCKHSGYQHVPVLHDSSSSDPGWPFFQPRKASPVQNDYLKYNRIIGGASKIAHFSFYQPKFTSSDSFNKKETSNTLAQYRCSIIFMAWIQVRNSYVNIYIYHTFKPRINTSGGFHSPNTWKNRFRWLTMDQQLLDQC